MSFTRGSKQASFFRFADLRLERREFSSDKIDSSGVGSALTCKGTYRSLALFFSCHRSALPYALSALLRRLNALLKSDSVILLNSISTLCKSFLSRSKSST